MKARAFTLVEVLVVIAVITVTGLIITEVFFRSIRGGNKAEILSKIKQNGQSALETMDKTIRKADGVICTSTLPSTVVIIHEGKYFRFRYNPPFPTQKPVRNGYITRDSRESCTDPTPPNAITLTDTSSRNGVSVVSGSFLRQRQAGFKDVIVISFKVGPAVGTPVAILAQVDPVTFKTTVELR